MTLSPSKSAMKPTKNSRRVRITSATPTDDDDDYYRPSTPAHHNTPVVTPNKYRELPKQAEVPVVENTTTCPPFNAITSVTAGPNPVLTHSIPPVRLQPGSVQPVFPGQQYPPHHFLGALASSFPATTNIASGLVFGPSPNDQIPLTTTPVNMAYYQNAFPPNYGAHFQPQVPDTSGGPMTHTYVPRFDNAPGVVVGHPQAGMIVGPRSCSFNTYHIAQPCYMTSQHAPVPLHWNSCCTYTSSFIPLGLKGEKHPIAPYYGPANTVHYQNGIPITPAVGPTIPLVNQQQAYQPAQIMTVGTPAPMMGAPAQGCAPMMGIGGGPALVIGGQPQYMPGNMSLPNATHFEPATGVGLTGMEVAADQAQNTQISEPQDFKPADDDPSRMYMVRQVDGCWTMLSRAAIDGVGDCRWYVDDRGCFYAVRLPG